MDDSRRNKSGESSTAEIPEPPPPTRQYSEPQQPTPFPPPPPAMGYPPVMGYPPGYHPNGYDQQYQQQQRPAPPDIYYAHRGPPNPASILATMMLFIFFTFILGFIMFLVSPPTFPVFHVETLTVTNFSVANDHHFTCAWEINLVAENKNVGAKVHFDRIQSFIYFHTDALLVSDHFDHPIKNVTIKSNEKGTINIKLSTADYERSVPAPNKKVMEAIRDERKTGVVLFALKAFAWSQVQTGMFYVQSKHIQSKIICDGLKVHFEGDTGNGKLNARYKGCEVDI